MINNIIKNVKAFNYKQDLIILCITLILCILNELLLKRTLFLGYFFKNHFNDFLAPFIFITILNIYLTITLNFKIVSLKILIPLIFIASFVWEYLAIFFKPGSVFDIIDILCYIIGIITYSIINKTFKKRHIIYK